MSKLGVYDNWKKLVDGVNDREHLHRLALCDSFSSTSSSEASTSRLNSISSSSRLSFNYAPASNVNFLVTAIFAKPVQLAEEVIKAADDAVSFKQDCAELKIKAGRLATLLRHAARASNNYERPIRRIIDNTEQVLAEALSLALKCCGNGLVKRVFITIIPADVFRKMSSLLENSAADISWLLRISGNNEYQGLPPIAANEPILCLIWELITILYTGNVDDRGDAAASLVSLARDNDLFGKLIIEEGGVGPLLKLMKEGKVEGQENAARAIGLLGKDPESVEHIIHAGVCGVFVKMLREGPVKVQAVVAWAISELVAHYPKCQDLFAQHNFIRFLVSHLAFEMVQEHSKYSVVSDLSVNSQPNTIISLTRANRGREMEDPATKAHLKAMAARALWHLAKGNAAICRIITDTRALLCFAVLLEKGAEEVQYNSAMALMEITAVAEEDAELRRSAFKPNSPVCKAVVDQLLRILEKADSSLLVPCIKAIGNLARTFRATETRMINPLVRLLDEQEAEVSREACTALTKFASEDNYLHLDHAKAIISAGGANHLAQLVYFEQVVQSHALVLLCYIALHVPDSEELAEADVLSVLEWASKQAGLMQIDIIEKLVPEAKGKFELYQSRKPRAYRFG